MNCHISVGLERNNIYTKNIKSGKSALGTHKFSQVYRWISDSQERRNILVQEPENAEIIQEYTRIQLEGAKH